jgi:outer membrane protein assembly factor BamB
MSAERALRHAFVLDGAGGFWQIHSAIMQQQPANRPAERTRCRAFPEKMGLAAPGPGPADQVGRFQANQTRPPQNMGSLQKITTPALLALLLQLSPSSAGEAWTQFKFDSRHSGNVPERSVTTPLGLVGAVPLTDAIFTSPVVADGRVYVVDGSGVAFCFDAATLKIRWKFESRGGRVNVNNVSSPALAGNYLHFGTMAGVYYVLDAETGRAVKVIECGEPIFSSPVLANDRVYFATLGSRVHALRPDGTLCWTWDFVTEVLEFRGDRWSGADWAKRTGKRVQVTDQFCCVRDLAAQGDTLVLPAGGQVVWLKDAGAKAEVAARVPGYDATFGLSLGEDGAVYRQWHRLDNGGRVEIYRRRDGKVEKSSVPGTQTGPNVRGAVSFSSVSLRGAEVFRSRPEAGFGLCKHAGGAAPQALDAYPSTCSPILLRDAAVSGGLDGSLNVAPLAGGKGWSFRTKSGKAIAAPPAVCDGHIYFGCEDGHLYALGPDGRAAPPADELGLWKMRSPFTARLAGEKDNWFTSFGNWDNANNHPQDLKPPFTLKWIHRFEGTIKHFSTCGGGRLYTHTAEGQVFAVEQETGRLLWRRYWPGVHISYTSPLYYQERLLVPQAGLESCRLRCLDAATGELIWEAPFAGSPSWNRQLPPVVHDGLVFYMFGTGRYPPGRTKDTPGWLFEHQDVRGFPADHKPLVKAWDLKTGKEAWTRDFSEFGSGGDESGLCLMSNTLYYSCFFGYMARRGGQAGPAGLTAALEPATGRTLWLTTNYSVHGGCTISGRDGRLYLGGYNRPFAGTENRYVWCLDARDGSLVWQSDPLSMAIQVVTLGRKFLYTSVQYEHGYLLAPETGKILGVYTNNYKCTRFTLSEPYLLGSNLDVRDMSNNDRLISSGPALDPSECVSSIPSNGRLFYTGQGGGLQACQMDASEAGSFITPWREKADATPAAK